MSCRGRWLYVKAEKNHTGSHRNTFKWENWGLPTACALATGERVCVCACVSPRERPRDTGWKTENKGKGGQEKGRKKEITRDTQMQKHNGCIKLF